MSGIVERAYTSADLPHLRQLWGRVYEPEAASRREAAYRWITERNPLCPAGAPRHLAFDADRLVGSLGRMPIRWRAGGHPFEMHWSHDLLVDPACRGRGLGKILVQAVARDAPSMAGGLWMTDACCRLHVSAGWKEVRPFRPQRLILDGGAALRRRVRSPLLAGVLAPAARAWIGVFGRRPGPPSRPIRDVDAFGRGTDALFERVAARLGCIAERTHAYLNWKYVDTPHLRYGKVMVGDPAAPEGYAVWRTDRKADGRVNGLIVDLLADPAVEGAFDSAVSAAVARLAAEGAQVVTCLVTHAPFRARLAAAGFSPGSHLHTFVITAETRVPIDGDPFDAASWYLTAGDSDGDMWSTAQAWAIGRQQTLPTRPSS